MPIVKAKGGFKIENTPGISKTKEQAVKRLRAIKASQNRESLLKGR